MFFLTELEALAAMQNMGRKREKNRAAYGEKGRSNDDESI